LSKRQSTWRGLGFNASSQPPELRFSPPRPFSRIVITLAQQIGETAHCSLLQRKARRHGLADLTSIMRLAVARGARHYAPVYPPAESDPGVEAISHEDLVALLLLGAQPFEPFALRCAAQIISLCDLGRLSRLARRERISRPLAHIARAGAAHDSGQAARWQELLQLLGSPLPVPSGRLPHWSRFVSHSGTTRSGTPHTDWLHACP
jgi:hypothetical protein